MRNLLLPCLAAFCLSSVFAKHAPEACTGSSYRLAPQDCNAWQKLYHDMRGQNWKTELCENPKTDPCGCIGSFELFLSRCYATIYMMSFPNVGRFHAGGAPAWDFRGKFCPDLAVKLGKKASVANNGWSQAAENRFREEIHRKKCVTYMNDLNSTEYVNCKNCWNGMVEVANNITSLDGKSSSEKIVHLNADEYNDAKTANASLKSECQICENAVEANVRSCKFHQFTDMTCEPPTIPLAMSNPRVANNSLHQSHPASAAVDGRSTTYAASQDVDKYHWLEVDLGAIQHIHHVTIQNVESHQASRNEQSQFGEHKILITNETDEALRGIDAFPGMTGTVSNPAAAATPYDNTVWTVCSTDPNPVLPGTYNQNNLKPPAVEESCEGTARFVRFQMVEQNIQRPSFSINSFSKQLLLAEVAVFGYAGTNQPKTMKTITLNNLDFGGSIPKALAHFSELKEFYLHNSNMQGSLPKDFAGLQNLTTMSITSNAGITGELPTEWSSMPALKFLYLTNNTITGQLPKSWEDIKTLKHIYINENSLTGFLPASWAKLPNIKQIGLQNNQLSGQLPEEWSNTTMTSLVAMYLENNFFVGTIPAFFSFHQPATQTNPNPGTTCYITNNCLNISAITASNYLARGGKCQPGTISKSTKVCNSAQFVPPAVTTPAPNATESEGLSNAAIAGIATGSVAVVGVAVTLGVVASSRGAASAAVNAARSAVTQVAKAPVTTKPLPKDPGAGETNTFVFRL